jgi:hypothetical protein
MPSLTFKPVYGWGWFKGPGTTPVEVPEPFTVVAESASEAEIVGLVEAPHEFAGFHIRLGLRSIEPEGLRHWNVYLSKENQGQVTGFAAST